ncbi:MAG TPA: hypothetical protein VJY39_22265 [Acidisphaera sp.]|nr:hypothetical protein [Acidisphaera sp.]
MRNAAARLRRFGWLIALAIVVSQGAAPGAMLRSSAQAATVTQLFGRLVTICHSDGGSGGTAHHDCQHCPDCAAAHLQPISIPASPALPAPRARVTPADWVQPPQHAPPAPLATPHARGPPASA